MSTVLALGLDAARSVDPASFAIGGVAPRAAVRPESRDELAEALRAASRERLATVPWGGGVSLAQERALPRYDLALDLGGLARVVEYDPEDLTITVECGMTLAALRDTLAARGQELPLEGSFASRATVGGVLATNASGPRRLRFGAPYDRLLGARFALADGTLARSGGRVVKNVAGYAVHRLLCGSRGALAVLVEASLKLLPAPERRVMLEYSGLTAAQIGDTARWAEFPRLELSGLSVTSVGDGSCSVQLGFEEEARWVEEQIAATVSTLGPPTSRIEGADVIARWQALADAAAELTIGAGPTGTASGGDSALEFATASNTPAALAPVLAAAPGARFVFHAPAGRLHIAVAPSSAQPLVHQLAEHGFTLIGSHGAEVAPALPPQQAVRDLRARLRAALDPAGAFATGDRWG